MGVSLVQTIAVYALPVILAITLHEAAHGYVAKHFGDLTAYQEGRVSLNPLRHIDPFGTIALPLATLAIGGIMFGWAKPVPVNFRSLRRPKRDMLWVAAAGPGANFAMALCWALVMKLASLTPGALWSDFLLAVGKAGIQVNVIFLVLNLLPVPPLDGGRIVTSLLPHRLAYHYSRIEPYGIFILLGAIIAEGLLRVPLLGAILYPPYRFVVGLIHSLAGL